mgnify:CR=1 FL=1
MILRLQIQKAAGVSFSRQCVLHSSWSRSSELRHENVYRQVSNAIGISIYRYNRAFMTLRRASISVSRVYRL